MLFFRKILYQNLQLVLNFFFIIILFFLEWSFYFICPWVQNLPCDYRCHLCRSSLRFYRIAHLFQKISLRKLYMRTTQQSPNLIQSSVPGRWVGILNVILVSVYRITKGINLIYLQICATLVCFLFWFHVSFLNWSTGYQIVVLVPTCWFAREITSTTTSGWTRYTTSSFWSFLPVCSSSFSSSVGAFQV